MKIRYSPDAADRLREIKTLFGKEKAKRIITAINGLTDNPYKCPSIENMLGIESPYYFLHIEQNYVFYKADHEAVYITHIFNEREDFMWKLFGIRLRTQESIDYWGE